MKYTGRVGPCKHGIGKVVCDALKDGGRCVAAKNWFAPAKLQLGLSAFRAPCFMLCLYNASAKS